MRRNNEIKRYFLGRESDLLVIDFSYEKTSRKLCEFLGIPDEYVIDVPHLNKS